MYDDLLVIMVPDARREGGPGPGPGAAVLHHRPLRRLQRGAGPAVPARRADRGRAGRDHHRGLGDQGAQATGASSYFGAMADRRSAAGRTRVDPARRAAYDVLTAVRVDDAYTNLVLPARAAQARAERPGRGVRHRAGVRHDLRGAGHLRRGPGRLPGPAAGARSRRRCSTPCGSAPTSCCPCGCPPHAAITTTVDLVRARVGPGDRPASPTPCSAGSPSTTAPSGSTRSRPTRRRTRCGYAVVAYTHPRWVVDELPRAARWRRDELEALLAADNDAAAGDAGGAARARRPRRSCPGTPTPYSPYGVVLDGGDPGAVPAVADGRAGVQDEGSQLVALALARCALARRGPDERWLDLCAGPGGKAALLAALAAERGAAAARRRASAAPGGAGRRVLCAGRTGGHRRRRRRRHPAPPGDRAPSTGCWSTRPAPGSGRCAAGPRRAGGAPPPTSTALVPLQRSLLLAALDLGPARGRGALRDLLTGARRDPRRRPGRADAPGPRRSSRTPGRCCPSVPDCATARCPAPSSSGRTGTAPTRCSWRCCATACRPRRLGSHDLGEAHAHQAAGRRGRGRRQGRAGQQPGPGLLPGERRDQAGPGRVLPRGRRRHRQRPVRAAVHAAPLPEGPGRGQGAPEAAAGGSAAVGGDGAAALPALEPHRRRAVRHRARRA